MDFFMKKFFRLGILFVVLCALLMGSATLASAKDETNRPNLPKILEEVLSKILQCTDEQSNPDQSDVNLLLRFLTQESKDTTLYPAMRKQGSGIFYRETMHQSLQSLLPFLVNPNVPCEMIYPSSIRRHQWMPKSEIFSRYQEFLKTSYPPAHLLFMHGEEQEESTPELTSGCFYTYIQKRLLLMTGMAGRTALISVSSMPKESSVGRKGAIVGKDSNWQYVYTQVEGTSLLLLDWAETHLYGSATITLFIESAPNSQETEMYLFKWAKAGWSGMNVVLPSHIQTGVKRFLTAFKQVLENPQCPSSEDMIAWKKELSQKSEEELRPMLDDFSRSLEQKSTSEKTLQQECFQQVLANGGYATTLSKEEALIEIMKLRLRKALGLK